MARISFVNSLMEFQRRVLTQGHIDENGTYDIEDLKQLLFFNKVFIGNTTEMYQKHNMNGLVDEYNEYLSVYNANVNIIISKLEEILDIQISGHEYTSFEKRLDLDKMLSDKIICKKYNSIDKLSSYKFKSDELYYIVIRSDGSAIVSYIDPKQIVYQNMIMNKYDGKRIYWRTVESIMEYLSYKYNTDAVLTIKVTKGPKKKSGKVEYIGSPKLMNLVKKIFTEQPVIFYNQNIFVDDIERLIDSNINNKVKPESSYRYVSIDKLCNTELLIEYPTDSFDIYLDFLSTVSNYHDTKSIHVTLYRIGSDPAIYYILRDAVSNGIDVTVNLEMYASGEEINKTWLREMRAVGIKVNTYAAGILKVHSKLTLVEFNSGAMICQIGTGNYHTKTTVQYTDFSFMTVDPNICIQVKHVFDIFESEFGSEPEVTFNNQLLVTRYNARTELNKLIDEEGSKGKHGCIIMKCNSLDDDEIIQHLESAAKKGCYINLIVRSVCTWIPNMSNVIVKSIVWDKLEHSRVYCFGNKNPKIYLGSLDLVTRKIERRIETLVKINNPEIIMKLCEYLNRYATTTMGSWVQTSSGMYIKE